MKTKTKVLEIPVSPEVAAFAVVMETKLQMEGLDMEESWQGFQPRDLLKQIRSKLGKLEGFDLEKADPHEIFSKAVALGCFAMMLAEKAATREAVDRPGLVQPKPFLRLLPTPGKKDEA